MAELAAIVGHDAVKSEPSEVAEFLVDNSWLSPILTAYFGGRRPLEGRLPAVAAVVSPGTAEELKAVVGLAVRRGVPITVRGGGTSNFGQVIPLHGGVVVDTRRLSQILSVTDDIMTAEAGTLQGEMNRVARGRGYDLTLLTTTHASATIGGWVAGGHVGVGTSGYGTIWDGNVLGVGLLTAEDPPRELVLTGDDVFPVLHTYGTVGVVTQVTVPLVPARVWVEELGIFDTFEAACRFVVDTMHEPPQVQRVIVAQEAPIPSSFTPLHGLIREDQSVVLMIIDEAWRARCRQLVREHGGRVEPWRRDETNRVSFTYMVYGHRMLWIKRIAPNSAFLHVYFRPSRELEQIAALKQRFGHRVWFELKYMNSRYLRELCGLEGPGRLPAAVLALVEGDPAGLQELMDACRAEDVVYWSPHTFVLEESGIFTPEGLGRILAFKHQTDPKGLLNPGKLTRTPRMDG
ncbi:MAG: FAD-binding oxidoreductase [Armatimonadota bacterium]|nr:FAD-binding oxidoreductase [Armatimonadota bacterium]MDR7489517.1 FAD-binding oxidoreductase [Armatimonadota bacterium]MDR7529064.1 FAD-binding oxidoreductase [Armatimonadota bacterium]